jgi:iron complex outermembrane receptor protein
MHNKKRLTVAVASVLAATTHTAIAQEQAAAGRSAALEEVVVTAQRRAENIQDVPMTITAITGQNIAEFKIFEFQDLSQLSPGLALENNGAFGSVAQLRGVGFDSNTSTSPAVDIYVNETPVDANYAFQTLYDIGQVEVLRGPQGTLRGRPSPAGAITVTTRRPELDGWGGTLQASGSDQDATNFQGGVTIPVIENQLALRIAGMQDDNEGSQVESVNSNEKDKNDTGSWRTSLRWMPTEAIDANLAYQWMRADLTALTEVEGPGAGYNGRPIKGGGYAVNEIKPEQTLKSELTTLNVGWELDRFQIVFDAAYQDNSFDSHAELDGANAVTHFAQDQFTESTFKSTTYELRLESTEEQFVDYLVGLWYQDTETESTFAQPNMLDGAFGSPLAPNPIGPPDFAFSLPVSGSIPVDFTNQAIYGSLVFHLTDKADFTVGARYLEDDVKRSQMLDIGSGLIAIDIATPAGSPPGVPLGYCGSGALPMPPFTGTETYPGYCDLKIDASTFVEDANDNHKEWVYDASLRYNFTDELMSYFTYAHSWRPAGVTVGITSELTPDTLLAGDPEETDSYELGLRSQWLDNSLRINPSIYYQDYSNYVARFADVPYIGAGDTLQSGGFSYPGDATVQGFEVEVTYDVNENWWVQWNTAYADGKFDDADVPCRDTNGDGNPDNGDIGNLTLADFGGNSVMFCTVDYAISTIPPWVSTLQSAYTFPIFGLQGQGRLLYNYYGDQEDYGRGFEADSYGILNLYLDIGSEAGDWTVTLWAKNVLDDDTQLWDAGEPGTSYGVFHPGYSAVSYVAEREVGLTLRYSFGEG